MQKCRSTFHSYFTDSFCEFKEPENGVADCTMAGDLKLCDLKCTNGFRPSGAHLFACDQNTGKWSPSFDELNVFPSCIEGAKK